MHFRADIKELAVEELRKILVENNFLPFHASQIFSWIYKKGAWRFSSMSDIPLSLRKFLNDKFFVCSSQIEKEFSSKDTTKRFTIKLSDNNLIEAVFIPESRRNTLCLSTQVGCKFSCTFCASSVCGWVRNLTAGEILDQIILIKALIANNRISHIVFMGIGEPLDNFENVLKAVRIINSPSGFSIGKRRITISSCGLVPAIRRLAHAGLHVELSVSLHASCDNKRSILMPINKKYPLKELVYALRDYQKETSRQITFEYALIKGFNTDKQSSLRLSRLLDSLDYKINLIVLNPISGSEFEPAGRREVINFKNMLKKLNIRATIRRPRGQDIQAACGQLRISQMRT